MTHVILSALLWTYQLQFSDSVFIILNAGSVILTVSMSDTCPNVTFTCSAVDLPATVFRWFLNDDTFHFYQYPILNPNVEYPITVTPDNATYNTLVGGVKLVIVNASLSVENPDSMASFLSTMTVNISALQEARISTVSCGRIMQRSSVNLTTNSDGGWYIIVTCM